MNDPRLVKKKVLGVLKLKPERWFTEEMVKDALDLGMLPEPVKVPSLQEAISQLHEANLIESRHDQRLEEIVWRITAKGLNA